MMIKCKMWDIRTKMQYCIEMGTVGRCTRPTVPKYRGGEGISNIHPGVVVVVVVVGKNAGTQVRETRGSEWQ